MHNIDSSEVSLVHFWLDKLPAGTMGEYIADLEQVKCLPHRRVEGKCRAIQSTLTI